MPDFEILPSAYSALPEFLLRTVPGFADSPEYQRVAEHRDLPGVVVGALRPFLVRLETASQTGKLAADEAMSLEGAYQAIEAMASANDPNVQNAVVVEIFEHLHAAPRVVEAIRGNLHPESQALYSRWIV